MCATKITGKTIHCDCGAAIEGKWADIHHPSCACIHQIKEIEDIIKHNCRAVEGWPMTIDGIENAAAAIYAKFNAIRDA